jgi:hypothetical protein
MGTVPEYNLSAILSLMKKGLLRMACILIFSAFGSISIIVVLTILTKALTALPSLEELSPVSEMIIQPQNTLEEILFASLFGSNQNIRHIESEDAIVYEFDLQTDPKLGGAHVLRTWAGFPFTISITNTLSLLRETGMNLPNDTAAITESLLRTFILKTFGNVSVEDTITPLLQGVITLHVSNSGSLIEGEGATQELIDALHTAVFNKLPKEKITSRVLDRRFNSKDIRYDENLIEQRMSTFGGWDIQETRHIETGEGLYAARQGDKFLLTKNQYLLLEHIEGKHTDALSLPTVPGLTQARIVMGGRVNASNIVEILKESTFASLLTDADMDRYLQKFTGTVIWSLTERGKTGTLTIKGESRKPK